MDKSPEIRLIFILTKNDCTDFDRDSVSHRLGINPTNSSPPTRSKGRLYCDTDICEIQKEFAGITVIPAASPPYQMIKHAYWNLELPLISCWSVDKPLKQFEQLFSKRAAEVRQICKDYDLYTDLVIRVFAESNNMPELIIPSSSVSFWASMGASISFDFYLD